MPNSERPWILMGRGNWLRFDPLTTDEVTAIVSRLDSDYGLADVAGRYAAAWLDVARLLSTLAAIPGVEVEAPTDAEGPEERSAEIYPEGRGCPQCDGTGFVSDETIELLRAKGYSVPWSEFRRATPAEEPS